MEKLLDLKDVMEIYGVGYSTVWRWRKYKAFPESVGVGKLLWTEQQIKEWLNRQSKPVTSAVTTTAQRTRDKKAFHERQVAADAALKRHATDR